MAEAKETWMFRAGRQGLLYKKFVDNGVVAIGAQITPDGPNMLGSLEPFDTLQAIKDYLQAAFPGKFVPLLARALHNVRNVMQVGDYVLAFNNKKGEYALGTIESGYEFNPDVISDRPHIRRVNWTKNFARKDLSDAAKNSLMATSLVYPVSPKAAEEMLHLTGLSDKAPTAEDGDDAGNHEDVGLHSFESLFEISGGKVKEEILSLGWEDMEKLVAGLLRAMGYKARVTGKGPDGGIDIVASKDGLGFEKPVIAVEVKHRPNTNIAANQIRSFLTVCRRFDNGLFVSTGGFTKDARLEAQKADEKITLMDIDMLIEHLLENYEKLDGETQSYLPPLKKLYWPV